VIILKGHGVSDGEYDPLEGLSQVDRDRNLLEKDALMLIVRMLDDVEDFDSIRNGIRDIVCEDVVLGTRFMKIFDVLIQGLLHEQKVLASLAVLP
jgi:hypothetical protein